MVQISCQDFSTLASNAISEYVNTDMLVSKDGLFNNLDQSYITDECVTKNRKFDISLSYNSPESGCLWREEYL